MSFILKYPLGRQHLKLYFYHNVFSMYFKFESEFNGEILYDVQSFTGHFGLHFTHEFYLNSEISIHYLYYAFVLFMQCEENTSTYSIRCFCLLLII